MFFSFRFIWLQNQIAIDDHPNGKPRPDGQCRLNIEIAPDDLPADLAADGMGGRTDSPVALVSAPITHAAGPIALSTLSLGATQVILPGFDAERVLRTIAEYKVTHMYLPPTALYQLLASPELGDHDYSSLRIFILVGSTVFSLTFRGVDGDLWVEGMLSNLPGGIVGFLIFVNVFVFLLAFFLDFFELAFIVIPLLGPAAEKIGIDLIWFGVILGVNMQTSFMHPPFGFALFYLRGIAPKEVKSSDIYWGALPWVGLQLVMVLLVMFWALQVRGRLIVPLAIGITLLIHTIFYKGLRVPLPWGILLPIQW